MEVMLSNGSSAEEIADYCCSRELILVAEGVEGATQDRATFIAGLAEDLNTYGRPCTFSLFGSVVSSGDVAAAFVAMRCKGLTARAPDLPTRLLFVWHRTNGQWKAIREMAATGSL
jgi:ketosteroid isomerase-like protein